MSRQTMQLTVMTDMQLEIREQGVGEPVVFENADHLIFFTNCRDAPWITEFLDWACYEPVWDRNRGHDLINHFVTAFLLAELKDDVEAAEALVLENVTFTGIRYETTAYTKP